MTKTELEEYVVGLADRVTCHICRKAVPPGDIVWIRYGPKAITYICPLCMDSGEAQVRG